MPGRKPILSICLTCREPLPGSKFTRHANGMRHDSCAACDRKIKAAKRLAGPAKRKRVRKTTTVAPRTPCKPMPTTIATRWIGGYPGASV